MSQRSRPSRRAVLHATAATLVAACRNTSVLADEKPAPIIDPHVHVWRNDPKYPWVREEKEPPRDAGAGADSEGLTVGSGGIVAAHLL